VAALHWLLLSSRNWGLGALPFLSRLAAAQLDQAVPQVLDYFQQLDYSLGPDHEQGLTTFFQYLKTLGELKETPGLEYFRGGG
jgi:hypothetical protein